MQNIGEVIFFLTDIVVSFLHGELPREMLMKTLEMQLEGLEEFYKEGLNVFEEDDDLPYLHTDQVAHESTKTIIMAQDMVETLGPKHSCPICLQDIEVGQIARCALQCNHLFHCLCLDQWLTCNNSCPICRRHMNL